MTVRLNNRDYTVEVGSDVSPRDGMMIELWDDAQTQIMEVYYDDPSGRFTVNTFGNDVDLELVDWLIAQARLRLTPKSNPEA